MKEKHLFFWFAVFSLSWLCCFLRIAHSDTSEKREKASDDSTPRQRFAFALIGDHPYDATQEAKVPFLMAELDAAKIAFVIHDGDFKSGSSLCDDATFLSRYTLFQSSRHPFIYLFGDNEWADCHRTAAGGFDPLERLARLRSIFTQGNVSLGRKTLPLTRQSDNPRYAKFRENVRWTYGEVLFVGFNIPGSNNNFPPYPTTLTDAQKAANLVEATERNEANVAWLDEAFTIAEDKKLRGLLLALQANMFVSPPSDTTLDGYQAFLAALEGEMRAFGKPVVLVHGDTHYFRIDKPTPQPSGGDPNGNRLLRLANFTRVETFGSPDVNWVCGMVDTKNPKLFSFIPQQVESER
ncbi:MAG: hypothetical protein AB7G75_13015 [Candidatus Binatia bacterium]